MTNILPRSSPAAEGLDAKAVRLLVDRFDDLDCIHSFVLVRNGSVIAEGSWAPNTADRPHEMFSVSKSFTATAVGLAIDEGLFGLDDRVVDLLASDAPAEPSANLAAMRVRHLLTMTTGHAADSLGHDGVSRVGMARTILALPVEHEPGTRFVYNTGATYLAGLIVQRLTGQRLLDYLRPRLFDPLGITTATWEQDADGFDAGGFGLSITIEELAAFGQLYLQRGQWRDRVLVPAAWVDAATAAQVPNGPHESPEWEQGYGYQFWRCRHGAYRADGAFGQFAIVWPEHQLVLAITAGTANMQSILDAVWDTLLPGLTAGRTAGGAVVEEAVVDTSGLWLRPPVGAPSSPGEASIRDISHRLEAKDGGTVGSLRLTRDAQGRIVLQMHVLGHDNSIVFGFGEWVPGVSNYRGEPAEVASAAAWTDESTLVARMVAVGTPFVSTVTLRLADGRIGVTLDLNVFFGPTRLVDATAVPVA